MGVVERGLYIAVQSSLQDVYESIQFDRDIVIKHGHHMYLQGVWSVMLHTGLYDELFIAVTEEMARIHSAVYR